MEQSIIVGRSSHCIHRQFQCDECIVSIFGLTLGSGDGSLQCIDFLCTTLVLQHLLCLWQTCLKHFGKHFWILGTEDEFEIAPYTPATLVAEVVAHTNLQCSIGHESEEFLGVATIFKCQGSTFNAIWHVAALVVNHHVVACQRSIRLAIVDEVHLLLVAIHIDVSTVVVIHRVFARVGRTEEVVQAQFIESVLQTRERLIHIEEDGIALCQLVGFSTQWPFRQTFLGPFTSFLEVRVLNQTGAVSAISHTAGNGIIHELLEESSLGSDFLCVQRTVVEDVEGTTILEERVLVAWCLVALHIVAQHFHAFAHELLTLLFHEGNCLLVLSLIKLVGFDALAQVLGSSDQGSQGSRDVGSRSSTVQRLLGSQVSSVCSMVVGSDFTTLHEFLIIGHTTQILCTQIVVSLCGIAHILQFPIVPQSPVVANLCSLLQTDGQCTVGAHHADETRSRILVGSHIDGTRHHGVRHITVTVANTTLRECLRCGTHTHEWQRSSEFALQVVLRIEKSILRSRFATLQGSQCFGILVS